MAYDSGSFEMAIVAAAGEDLALRAELRSSFADSATHLTDLLSRARCDGNWLLAARRLEQLAASFHCGRLVVLAQQAMEGAPGDPVVLRKLQAYLADLRR